MIDAGILEGDLLVVEQQPNAPTRRIVVAIVTHEFTVQYLERKGRFRAKGPPTGLSVIRPEGFEIFGVMAGLVRRPGSSFQSLMAD